MKAMALAALALAGSVALADETVLKGTVVDADGKPVAGAEVGTNWQLGDGMKAYDGVTTGEDGTFSITIRYYRPPTALLAFDAKHERGAGIVVAEADAAKPQTLALAPVATVKGSFVCTDASISAAGTSIQWQFGKVRIGNTYAKQPSWEVRLPPGAWRFWIYHQKLASLVKEFDVAADGKEMDLGELKVEPCFLATMEGKVLPDWKVSDARGVAKSVQPKDYKGKWLLVEFWGFW